MIILIHEIYFSTDYNKDILSIYDIISNNYNLIETISGYPILSRHSFGFISQTNQLFLNFSSDLRTAYMGFKFKYKAINTRKYKYF